jgi:hypothetical protein
MVDNIKFNKMLPSLSPASKVSRVNSKGRDSQQTPFKQRLDSKRKKKKKNKTKQDRETETLGSSGTDAQQRKRGAQEDDRGSRPGEPAQSKLIDIRV